MNCVRMKLAVNLMLISLAKHAQVAFTRQAFGVPTGILNHHHATIQTNKSVRDEICRDERCCQPRAHPAPQARTSLLSQGKYQVSQQQTNKPQVAFTR